MATLAADLSHQSGPHLFQVRAQTWVYAENSNETFNEVGLLYGRATRGPVFALAAAAGVGVARPCDLSGCATTVGVPLMARAAVRSSVVGLAVQFVMNVNPKHTVSAIQVMLEIGKLH